MNYLPLGFGRPQSNIATSNEDKGADMASAFNEPTAYAGSPLNAKITRSKIGGPAEVPLPPRLAGVTTSAIKVPQTIERRMTLLTFLVAK